MRERGSVLMLMPAAVLVLAILGGLAADVAQVYLAEREMSSAAAAAANDAATQAIDLDGFYESGDIRLVEDRARAVALRSVAARNLDRFGARVESVDVSADGRSVTVVVSGRSPHLFAKALPGRSDGTNVSASAVAEAHEG